jgi:hypothetical protein
VSQEIPRFIQREESSVHARAFEQRQTRGLRFATISFLFGAMSLAGCTAQPTLKGTWAEGSTHGDSYQRILVVGVTPHVNQRCAFERFLVSRISSVSTTTVAIASCDAVVTKNPLTRESIDAAVELHQADAVLATILVSSDWGAEEGGSRDTRGGAYYKATGTGWASGYYGVYGIPVVYGTFQTADAVTTLQGEVQVETRLFETRGPSLVYTLETTAQQLETRDSGLAALATPIAERLHRDGLVR